MTLCALIKLPDTLSCAVFYLLAKKFKKLGICFLKKIALKNITIRESNIVH